MHLPRTFELSADARAALAQVVGIMTDQVMEGEDYARWDYDELMRLEHRFGITMGVDDVGTGPSDAATVTVGMDDVARKALPDLSAWDPTPEEQAALRDRLLRAGEVRAGGGDDGGEGAPAGATGVLSAVDGGGESS